MIDAKTLKTSILNLGQRDEWCSLIAQSDPNKLCDIVDQILDELAGSVQIRVTSPAQTGTIQLPIREPVCEERFLLADAMVTVAEVALDNTIGWCMWLGSDKKTATAGAIADALLTIGTFPATHTLVSLLSDTHRELIESRVSQWQELGQTIIDFEELD